MNRFDITIISLLIAAAFFTGGFIFAFWENRSSTYAPGWIAFIASIVTALIIATLFIHKYALISPHATP